MEWNSVDYQLREELIERGKVSYLTPAGVIFHQLINQKIAADVVKRNYRSWLGNKELFKNITANDGFWGPDNCLKGSRYHLHISLLADLYNYIASAKSLGMSSKVLSVKVLSKQNQSRLRAFSDEMIRNPGIKFIWDLRDVLVHALPKLSVGMKRNLFRDEQNNVKEIHSFWMDRDKVISSFSWSSALKDFIMTHDKQIPIGDLLREFHNSSLKREALLASLIIEEHQMLLFRLLENWEALSSQLKELSPRHDSYPIRTSYIRYLRYCKFKISTY